MTDSDGADALDYITELLLRQAQSKLKTQK